MRQFLKVKSINLCVQRPSSTTSWPRQIFSAIQPTGDVHLGNYLGAIKNWVHLQNAEENRVIFSIADLHSITIPKVKLCAIKNWVHLQNAEENRVIFSIADLHSITIPKEPKELQNNIFKMTATLLACGIDTNKSLLFQQSMIPQHSELSWILGTLTTMLTLTNLPQFKEKSELVNNVNTGIFMYPVLQAADIMLYRATHIPVGEDQVQQIQLAMHLAKVFNNKFGDTFPLCEVIIDGSSGRVKSLTMPTKKMSKSERNTKSAIYLIDDPDTVHRKCLKAVTDCTGRVTYDQVVRPGVSNLIDIYSSISGKPTSEIVVECKKIKTEQLKMLVAAAIIEYLQPVRKKITDYLKNKEYLIKELEKGAEEAKEIAESTMKEVKERMGFSLYNLRAKKVTNSEVNDLDKEMNSSTEQI